ncbi:MAG TPA: carbon-nitrogen hydrolase family protein [Dongiaceae bacterium]|nr:carbon-nitrogen hydrolase family protein [Dongiaceae bacterium]
MRVALGQTIGFPGDINANLDLMGRLAAEAATRGAELLVLPELFLSGYNIGDAMADLAQPLPGPASRAAAEIARRNGLAIAYGFPERAAEGLYNTVLLVDRHGQALASYRKSHLWGEMERALFLPGGASPVFDFLGLRTAFMICYDLDFPEIARQLALDGAEAIICLSATTKPYHVVPRMLVPARAYENRIFVLFANRAGSENGLEYVGESCLAAPDGSVLAKGDAGPELIIGEIAGDRFAAFQRDHAYRADRRPELYLSRL